MILGGGRDELERGLGGERGGRAGGAVPFLEAPGRSRAGQSCGLHPQGCSWAVQVAALRKQWWKAFVLCVFPSSQSLLQISLLYLSLYRLPLPLLPSAWENPVRINKSSRLLRDKGREMETVWGPDISLMCNNLVVRSFPLFWSLY